MLSALLLALALPSAVPADDPPIRVRLDGDRYYRGDRGRAWIETENDGYVVVLHADADARVRVLFPLDPPDDAFVRGGEKLELGCRGDREAFFVDEREGAGLVLAAYSPDPFTFDPFVRGDHWDYRVLGGPEMREDREAGLLEIVRHMAAGGRFEYDVARYVVGAPLASGPYRFGYADPYYGGYSSRFRVGVFYGHPSYFCTSFFCDRFRYGGFFYDPFFSDPFFDPFCYDAFFGFRSSCFRSGFAFRRMFVSRPFAYTRVRTGTIVRTPRFVIPRERSFVTPIEPRRRTTMPTAGAAGLRRVDADVVMRGRGTTARERVRVRHPEARRRIDRPAPAVRHRGDRTSRSRWLDGRGAGSGSRL